MRYHDVHKQDGTITVKVVCALLFIFFAFFWLYWFQADVLAVAQHVLSGGKTHYNRIIGALFITLGLFVLHLAVYAAVRLSRRSHALTYLPSMLILAVLSDIPSDIDRHFSLGAWPWVIPIVLLLWGGAVWLAKQILPFSNETKEPTGLFSSRMWINLLIMSAMMLGVALIGNTNAVFHYTARAEASLMKGDADEALRVGWESLETDENLTMLRAFALSTKGELGEHFFDYEVTGTSADLLPLKGSNSRLRMMPDSLLWNHFGRRPEADMTTARYLDSLECDTLATPAFRDYRLVGLLIDRQVDSFALVLPRYYTVNDSLPRHYREALQIYQHRHGTTVYTDTLMQAMWNEYAAFDVRYPVKTEREIRIADFFRNTYWFYFFR